MATTSLHHPHTYECANGHWINSAAPLDQCPVWCDGQACDGRLASAAEIARREAAQRLADINAGRAKANRP